jgi:hypothetical protein
MLAMLLTAAVAACEFPVFLGAGFLAALVDGLELVL